MKISEQARKAAHSCRMRPEVNHPTVIQEAINDHERDLVEAAEKVLAPLTEQTILNAIDKLKAALDRRKE